MPKQVIDHYGFPSTSVDFNSRKLTAYKVIKDGDYTYLIFGDYTTGPIHRIDESVSGTQKLEWSYGAVADKATLQYVPINETIEIDA